MSDIIFILIVTCTIPSLYFTFDRGLTVTVNFIFTLREPNFYKPHGFFLGFLATFICFCVTVLFYLYLYFVVNQIELQKDICPMSHRTVSTSCKIELKTRYFLQNIAFLFQSRRSITNALPVLS